VLDLTRASQQLREAQKALHADEDGADVAKVGSGEAY
jgi:hypothetical protein